MQLIKHSDILQLTPHKIEELILSTIGSKTTVKKEGDKLYILCIDHNSCFEIMRRMRLDFDYSVHKKGKHYLVEI